MPLEMLLQYDIVEELSELESNAYHDYTTNCFALRSKPECLFEQYCDESNNVEWVFKNGRYRSTILFYCLSSWK